MTEVADSRIFLPPERQFGFCEGVEAAHGLLRDVTDIAQEFGIDKVVGFHEIVHNDSVTDYHRNRGVDFVSSLDEIPPGSIVVGSAHGSSPEIPWTIKNRLGGLFIDGACPLVIHTHKAIQTARKNDERVLYLTGKPDPSGRLHDEVIGSLGHMDLSLDDQGNLQAAPVRRTLLQLDADPNDLEQVLDPEMKYRIVGQTTLLATACIEFRTQLAGAIASAQPGASIERVDKRDVCFAVEDRQDGVRVLISKKPGTVIVATDPKSKNGLSYVKLAEDEVRRQGIDTEVIAVKTVDDLPPLDQLKGRIAITASASTPDEDTRAIVEALGGDGSLVPFERPSFKLNGGRPDQIRKRIVAWKTA